MINNQLKCLHYTLIEERYDADKNFAPCVTNGKHPHWAVVRGFVYKIPEMENNTPVHTHFATNEAFVELDSDRPTWFHTTQSSHGIFHCSCSRQHYLI